MATKRFDNQRVWVTGASSGIGEALARAFVAEGAHVVISARSEDKLQALAAEAPDRYTVVPLDVSEPEQIARVHAAVAEAGPVDILVNNAGITQWSKAQDTQLSVVRRIMEVNFFGTVDLTQRVVKDMLTNGRGQIVVISSINGVLGTPKSTGYAASKHALHGYFDGMRAELTDRGITVTMVCPGFVATGVGARSLTADGSAFGDRARPPKNALRPEELARTTLDAIHAKKREIYPGGREVAGVYLKRFLPGLTAKIVARGVK